MLPRIGGGVRALGRFVGRFGLVVLLTVGVLFLPTPAGLSDAGQRALAGFVFTAGILALEPVALPIAALIVPLALVGLRVADTPQAFETFSRPVVFLVLGSLFLAEALRKHGLTRRLALRTLVASGGGISALIFAMMSIAALLSMWIENTAVAAMLIPVAMTIARQVEGKENARSILVMLVLGIAYGASLGGMVTIMGSASNAVASSFLAQLQRWTFVDWMKYGLPAFLVVFPLTWALLLRVVRTSVRRVDVVPVREQLAKLGKASRVEKEIIVTLAGAIVLWVAGPSIEVALSLPPTLLSAAMVAVLTVAYLAVRGIITWDDVKGVSWGIFLIIGAGLSLGEALSRSGATEWFSGLLAPLVSGVPFLVALLILVFASAILTNVLNNTAIAAVFVPVVIGIASVDPSVNAVQLVLPVTLATTFGYSLPSASGRMALIHATGILTRGEMMRYGLIMTLASSLALALFFYVLAVVGWI